MPTIRLAGRDDAAAMASIYAPSVTGAVVSFEEIAPSADVMAERLAAVLERAPWLVCELDGALAGYAYASPHHTRPAYRWSVDVSVYVGAARQRRGVARALYTSLLALLRLQGFCAAHAGISLPNPASVALHERFGFEPVGVYRAVGFKHGAWHDVGWWQLPLRDRCGAPPPLLSLTEAARLPTWAAAMSLGLGELSG
jgi:L-amino acid N-acyltransferase YncA